jgi:hypothetical protein
MAKYEITHTCGCNVTHQIAGPIAGRDSKVEWLSGQECFACRTAWENEAAKAKNESGGYVALAGSEKQIAWAESIRAKAAAELAESAYYVDDEDAGIEPGHITTIINSVSEAKWWIDNRTNYMPVALHAAYADLWASLNLSV